MRVKFVVVLLTPPLVLAACSDGPEADSPSMPEFSEIAMESRRVSLEDSELALIGDLRSIVPRENGNMVVVDQMTHRVLEFDPEGGLMRWAGRPGDGPGEFRSPMGIALIDDGALLVAGPTRVTRLSSGLEFEANLRIEGSYFFSGVYATPESVVLGTHNPREAGYAFAFLNPESGALSSPFVPRHPLLLSVPYWNALFRTDITWFQNRYVVSHNMVYPLYVFDRVGTPVDSLTVPPASWIEAPRPEPGAFAMAPWRAFEAWQREFTIMSGVFAVGDSWLIVAHRVFPVGSQDPEYRIDVYNSELEKLYTDVLIPGRPIHGGDGLWVITAEPPSPWTLSCFQLI